MSRFATPESGADLSQGAGVKTPAPVLSVLAWLWYGVFWFWITLLLSWLMAAYVSVLVTAGGRNTIDLPVLRLARDHPWPVLLTLTVLVLLTPAAYLAHRRRRPWSPYVLKRVITLAPVADRFVPRYLSAFYLYRVADPDAREALRLAARRQGDEAPLGICVTGAAMLGKTRLAWEAMQAELPDWTLVRWPLEGRPRFDFAALHGRRVVLWLDDLQKYAGLNLAPTLNDLPRCFAQAGVRLVVVATCRDGNEMALAAASLGPLLSRLIEIRPAELVEGDAIWHAAALKYAGMKLNLDHFDGTPGSMLLGAQHMREEGYPALPRSARRVLWAMKLLRSAGLYLYPVERVRAAVQDVFRLEPHEWRRACSALVRAGFVRVQTLPGGQRALVPLADLYLDDIVPNYSMPGAHISEGWPELEKSLARRHDADALNQLGLAFLELDLGNPRTNAEHAEACFRTALADYQRRRERASWAIAGRNLGLAYWSQAQVTEGAERAMLLARAVEVYGLAWRVAVWEHLPLHGALTQHGLGTALNRQAALAGASQRARLLEESIGAYREALLIYQRSQALDELAMTQQNLGAALSEQAKLAQGEERAQLLTQAQDAYRAALELSPKEALPGDWAMTRNNLGLALLQQAELATGDERARLLDEALACHQAALEVYSRDMTPAGWALTQVHLGNVLRHQAANNCEGTEDANNKRAARLEQAIIAYRAALEVYTSKSAPEDWAMTQNNLGNAQSDQALLLPGKKRLVLLRQAVASHQAALTIYTRSEAPLEWAGAHLNLAQVHLQRARALKGSQREKAKPLAQAAECIERALTVFTPDTAPTYHALALQVQQEIQVAGS
jgi:tetratricopeptide (TPR) repeat protein